MLPTLHARTARDGPAPDGESTVNIRKSKQLRGPGVTAALLLLLSQPALALNQQDKIAGAAGDKTGQYVGVDACKTCHEDLYKKNFENTPHFKTTLKNGHGCESCHGPGSEHV